MLFKLTLPRINKTIEGGRIMVWYKKEGEWVDYGDELCEIHIEKMKRLNRSQNPIDILFDSQKKGDRFSEIKAAKGQVKVCASDCGFLRLINVSEKKEVNVGDFLAILTTDENDLIPDNINLDELTNFRVVLNVEDIN